MNLRKTFKNYYLFFEKYLLSWLGVMFGHQLLEQLVPYNVEGFEEKIRLGNLSDGGYVIPKKALSTIDAAYCYGIDYHIDFEEDLIKRVNIPIRFYDHTVRALPLEHPKFYFKKQGIAEEKYGPFDTFENHLKENGDGAKKIMLKMDIEGFEWRIIYDIVEKFSDNISVLIMEIHRLYRYEKIIKYIKTLKKINSKFTLIHLHGNNNSEIFKFANFNISSVLELTFINNKFAAKKNILPYALPSKYDYPNIAGKKDIVFDFWLKKPACWQGQVKK